jgi:hypothetical protein
MLHEITDDFTTCHGMPHQRHAIQAERVDEAREVVRQRVVVVAIAGMIGAPVAAPVVSKAAQVVLDKADHLVLPHPGAQRPTTDEHNGFAFAPVLVIELDAIGSRQVRHRYESPPVLFGNQAAGTLSRKPKTASIRS